MPIRPTTGVALAATILALALAAASRAPVATAASPAFTGGTAVLVEGSLARPSARGRRLAARRRRLHVREVSLIVPVGQASVTAVTVGRLRGVTPPFARVAALTRALRGARLRVRLVPLLDERALGHTYRGTIAPRDRALWFASYGRLVARFASLARASGATGLTIGTELDSMSGDEASWLGVLAAVRARFAGDVSFAMNWPVVRDHAWPAWLAQVDRIGVDAWIPVPLPDTASPAQIAAQLGVAFAAPLADLRRAFPRQRVVFAEAGLRGQPGSFRLPYVWDNGTPDDDGMQRRWYRAMCDWGRAQGIDGITWWSVDLDLPGPGIVPNGFNPLGRPAEDEVRRCFAAA